MLFSRIRAALVTKAPFFVRFPIKFIPPSIQQAFMRQVLQKIFHEALAHGDFAFLQQRWLEICVVDIDFKNYISFQDDKLIVENQIDKVADVCFSGHLNDLILVAARKEDPDTLFFQRRLLIEGDTELALEVKNLMDSVELDSLPTLMRQGLFSLADFVQNGLKDTQEEIAKSESDYRLLSR